MCSRQGLHSQAAAALITLLKPAMLQAGRIACISPAVLQALRQALHEGLQQLRHLLCNHTPAFMPY